MGQTPSIVNAYHLAWLEEYHTNCVLSRLADVFVFWYNSVNKKLISKDDFDVLFGSIPGLSEGHFDLYADDSIGRAPFHDILFTMILFANDSMRHKIFFLMKLKFLCSSRESCLTVTTGNTPPDALIIDSTYIYETFYAALCGLQHVFNIRIPEHVELQRIWEVNIEEMNKRNRTFDLLEKKKKQYRNLYELTISELYDLCLDMKDCSNYLGAIEEICDHLLTYKHHISALKKLYDVNKHDTNMTMATPIGSHSTDDRCISKSSICAYMLKETEVKAKQALDKLLIGQGLSISNTSTNSNTTNANTNTNMGKGQQPCELFSQRMERYQRHPLWDFVVLDLSNASWQEDAPRTWHDDEVTTPTLSSSLSTSLSTSLSLNPLAIPSQPR